jgi:hypothetical protein
LYLLRGDFEPLENLRGDPFTKPQDAEKEMLRADIIMLESVGLITSKVDNLPYPFGEFVIHILL